MPQAFDWKWFGKKGDGYRMPNMREARSMSWQMIANGANGLIYYCYHHMKTDQPLADFERDWKMFCDISEEISPLIPLLIADPAANANGYPKGTSGRAWVKDGHTYLLVVNEEEHDISASLTLPEKFSSVKTTMDKIEAQLSGSNLSFTLPALGVTIFRLDK